MASSVFLLDSSEEDACLFKGLYIDGSVETVLGYGSASFRGLSEAGKIACIMDVAQD